MKIQRERLHVSIGSGESLDSVGSNPPERGRREPVDIHVENFPLHEQSRSVKTLLTSDALPVTDALQAQRAPSARRVAGSEATESS